MSASTDHDFMSCALALAARGLGDTWPNPTVGCVIVKDGVVVGRGWTQSGGRPHAETEALRRAGSNAKGATAYVSLEPCSHHGKTPPCAEALIAAGIKRVVAATTDPDPRVSGQGLAKLRAGGIEVVEGVGKAEADRLNAGFFTRITKNRPLFALKTATSLDGRIALANGESKWITGPKARHANQALRARFDAVLVGSETVLQDDPELTCRLRGYAGRPKVRIVLDRRLRTDTERKVTHTKAAPTWIYTTQNTPTASGPLRDAGVQIVVVDEADFLSAVASDLAAKGLTRILVEGGGQVGAALHGAGLIDELYWFRGGQVLGGDARPTVAALGLDRLTDAPQFKRRELLHLGDDTLEVFSR
jgi:diaminohydroxyphosphoribosylaminopyrimidine deaminase/5-amino-6-(5-phosphoribosylamino)uracil reductase